MVNLRTRRLRLDPVVPSDLDSLHELWTEPVVRQYLWDDEIIARETVAEIITTSQESFETKGHGLWLARLGNEAELAGFGGFWHFHQPPQLELLFGIAPTHHGRGLATELAEQLIEFGFSQLGFDPIVGSTDLGNVASQRVMTKAGMTFDRQEVSAGLETLYFQITRRAWSQEKS